MQGKSGATPALTRNCTPITMGQPEHLPRGRRSSPFPRLRGAACGSPAGRLMPAGAFFGRCDSNQRPGDAKGSTMAGLTYRSLRVLLLFAGLFILSCSANSDNGSPTPAGSALNAAASPAPTPPFPYEARGSDGRTVRLARMPARIVSLSPGTTESCRRGAAIWRLQRDHRNGINQITAGID